MPPFGTGLGKSIAEEALAEAGYPWSFALFVLVSALTGGAVLRATARIFFSLGVPPDRSSNEEEETSGEEEEPEISESIHRTPVTMVAAILILLGGSLAVGVLPHAGAAVSMATERFIDRSGYVAQALHAAAATPVEPSPKAEWTDLGVGLGVLSAALAIAFAALALYAPRLPELLRLAARPVRPVLVSVRRLHSGHVGDYVTWLLVGVVGLAALIGLPLL
jgi:multicomponent Na+:H+ antiporter subunit D